MNERLVEDWLTKANERLYQTPFAQSLLAEGMQVLRIGHGSHEHGKDIIAVDPKGKVHAYQLKDGDLGVKEFEKEFGQITALVETQVEHPAIKGQPLHQPWLVISGQASMPVEDRIRAHNLQWKRRRYTPLKLITGRQLLAKFAKMGDIVPPKDKLGKADLSRRLSAANLFASYALSPFQIAKNHWELIQGWIITAARIAWAADKAKLSGKLWRPTFRLAVDAAITALDELCEEALQPNALHPNGFELDELTRSRCTICAGIVSAKILIHRKQGKPWQKESLAKEKLEDLFTNGRHFLWGESAVPFFLAEMWALDQLRADQFSDQILFAVLSVITQLNSVVTGPKPPSPYDSADEANSKALRRLLEGEKAMELQSAASYTLESLVNIAARRMWRNALAAQWSRITKIDLIRLVPDKPRDLLLWDWGYESGSNQSRRFAAPQSWRELLIESRRDESDSVPAVIKDDFDFALLFVLCFPHRLTRAIAKHFEGAMRQI